MGLWVMALLISSSIICTTDMTPKFMGIPALGAFRISDGSGDYDLCICETYFLEEVKKNIKQRKREMKFSSLFFYILGKSFPNI